MPPHLQIPALPEISRHFAPIPALKKIRGPRSLRRLLRDASGQRLSQAQLGALLGHFNRRGYTGGTLSNWERAERRRRLPRRYIMADKARAAYRALLTALVTHASNGRLEVRARLGKRVWHVHVVGHCRRCERPFRPRSIRAVHCWQCVRR